MRSIIRSIAGRGLMVVGLGLAAGSFMIASKWPSIPLWVFLGIAFLAGAPPMVIGARLANRGSDADCRRDAFQCAVGLGFAALFALLWVAPVFVMATGLVPWDPVFLSAWVVVWGEGIRFGARRIRRLYVELERRAMAWWAARHPEPMHGRDGRGTDVERG